MSASLVLGASGRIGGDLCQALRDQGWEVIGVARFRDPAARRRLEAIGVHTVAFDLLAEDPRALPDAGTVFLEVWNPQDIGNRDPAAAERIWSLNFHAVGRVVRRYAGQADFINGSTGSLYGPKPEPAQETDPAYPDTQYGLARLAQEHLIDLMARENGSRAVHLRYYHANTADDGMIRKVAEAVFHHQSLGPHPDQRLSVIGRRDFVRCTLAAERRLESEPQRVNVCHPRVWTLRELAETLRQRLGRGELVFDRPAGGLDASICGDATRMQQWFGPPQEDLDALIDAVCRDVLQTSSG